MNRKKKKKKKETMNITIPLEAFLQFEKFPKCRIIAQFR